MQKGINASVAVGIIAVIVMVLGGLFLLIGKKNIEENATVPQNQSKVETTSQAAQVPAEKQSDTITYENKEYGFSLELPKSWEGKYVVLANDFNKSEGLLAIGMLEFYLPTADIKYSSSLSGHGSVFRLDVYNISDWEKQFKLESTKGCNYLGCLSEMSVVGRTGKYIITVSPPQDIPADWPTAFDLDPNGPEAEFFSCLPSESSATIEDCSLQEILRQKFKVDAVQ